MGVLEDIKNEQSPVKSTKVLDSLKDNQKTGGKVLDDIRNNLEGTTSSDTGAAPVNEAGPAPSSPTSFWQKLGRSFEILGEAEMVNSEAHALSGEAMLWAMRQLGRADNAIATSLKYSMRSNREYFSRAGSPRSLIMKDKLESEQPGGLQGLVDGFLYKDETMYRDLKNEFFLGEEYTEKLDAWMNSHLASKIYWKVDELAYEMLAGAVTDAVLLAGVGLAAKPLLKVSRPLSRAATNVSARVSYHVMPEDLYTKKYWNKMYVPDATIRKGPSEYLEGLGKQVMPEARSFDDILKANIAMGDDVEKQFVKVVDANVIGDIATDVKIWMPKKGIPLIKKRKIDTVPDTYNVDFRNRPTAESLAERGVILDNAGKVIGTPPDKAINVKQLSKPFETKIKGLGESLVDTDVRLKATKAELDDIISTAEFDPTEVYGDVIDMSSKMRRIETKQSQIAKIMAKKEMILDQIASNKASIGEVYRRAYRTPSIDYQKVSRAIREDYADRLIRAHTPEQGRDIKKTLDDLVDAVTNGKKHFAEPSKPPRKDVPGLGKRTGRKFDHRDLDLLSDEEFTAIFSYMPYLARDPKSFRSAFAIKHPTASIPAVWMHDRFGPQDRWFDINNAGQISDVARGTDLADLQDSIRYYGDWEEILERNFGKGARKNKELQRAIFHAADGNWEMAENIIKFKNLKVSPEGITEAATFLNDSFDEIADSFEAAARWGEGLERKRFYIRHIVKRAVEEAGDDVHKISRMVEPYDNALNTHIDISEFKNRVIHDHPILENADAAFRAGMQHELYKLHWEPAFSEMRGLAKVTGSETIMNYTEDFIKYGIKGEITRTEREVEPLFRFAGKVGEKVLNKIPGVDFHVERRATRQILSEWRKVTYHGALAYRPKPAIRNAFQSLLAIPLSSYGDYWNGMRSLFTEGGQRLANSHCDLLIGRVPLVNFDISTGKGFIEAGHKGFKWVDRVPNVKGNFNTYVHHFMKKSPDNLDIIKKYGYRGNMGDTGNFEDAIAAAMDAGKLQDVRHMANTYTRISQFSYRPIAQPKFMATYGPVGKALGQFTTWPANYWGSYLPELSKRFLTGKDMFDNPLSRSEQWGLGKLILNGEVIKLAGKSMGVDLSSQTMPGTIPAQTAPFADFIVGGVMLGVGAGKGDADMANQGMRKMSDSFTFLPPLAITDIGGFISGEKSGKSLLFRVTEQNKKKATKSLPGLKRKRRLGGL